MKSLSNYRIANHLNVSNIADYLNIDAKYYVLCENGELDLDIEELEKLADLYGIDIQDFNEDTGVKNCILRYLFNESNRTVTRTSDLVEIAKFRRVVKAYEKMNKIFK